MIWGGQSGTGPHDDGGRYDPASGAWTALPTSGAPPGRLAPQLADAYLHLKATGRL